MRRLFIILAVGAVLIGAGVGAYFYFMGGARVAVAPPTLPEAGSVSASTTDETPQTVETLLPTKVTQRLVQISKGPVVAGTVAYTISSTASSTLGTNSSSDTAINYIERQSGNVFQYLVGAGTQTRTSNKTIPGIQEAWWRPDGSSAYVRYLSARDSSQASDLQDTINTYALPVTGVGGFFLAQNITSLAVGATNILTLASGNNGSIGTVYKPDGSNSKQVFTTPLSSLRIGFLGPNQYLAVTKPSESLAGFAFLVNSTGNFERIAGPLNGLAALASPSGKWVLLSYTSGNLLRLSLYEVATRTLLPLPVGTIVDKCAWTKDDRAVYCGVPHDPPTKFAYPDDWYQGAVSFSDRIWSIDVLGRFAELTLDFNKEAGEPLDAVALTLDAENTVLVFKNKNDASLWSYKL